jgi:GT2 family glycosyltransferase
MLSIIFVNYKTSRLIDDCIVSIIKYEKHYSNYEYILVDNNSDDPGLNDIEKKYPFIKVIRASRNGGFSYGNNIGIRASSGDLILLLNPDTYIEENAIEKMVVRITSDEGLHFIGPQLLSPDKSNQSYFLPKTYLTLWRHFCERLYLYRLFPNFTLCNSYYRMNMDYTRECYVEQLSGAAFLFKKSIIQTIGLMDENYFMYFEESDYCLQAKKNGLKMLYYPESKIIHIGGLGSPANWDKSAERYSKSLKYYFRKNFGIVTLIAACLLQAAGAFFRMSGLFLARDERYRYHFYYIKHILYRHR